LESREFELGKDIGGLKSEESAFYCIFAPLFEVQE
jgi:hypothetical protein